ncbi:TraR/DksA family transcriptional regulator [Cupriavidus sp. WS]|uniref:TraR/DksA family transcriptional regulator n=1 Tax=Cupriavidus sp. WS TaxID=1312922 RepID=UPI0003820A05|nr:TraR/DksA family transcriptional regulator [Cupriavidus sp. WS]
MAALTALTEEQRNGLALVLDGRETQLRAQVAAADAARTVATRPEPGDAADIAEEEAAEQAMADRHRVELADIAAARARLAGQTYGLCVDCGADIPYARLQAYPTAKRCLPCQSRHEQARAAAG